MGHLRMHSIICLELDNKITDSSPKDVNVIENESYIEHT